MNPVVVQIPQEDKLVKSFKDTHYFDKGTYKRDFV